MSTSAVPSCRQALLRGGRWYGRCGSAPTSVSGPFQPSWRKDAANWHPAWPAPMTTTPVSMVVGMTIGSIQPHAHLLDAAEARVAVEHRLGCELHLREAARQRGQRL